MHHSPVQFRRMTGRKGPPVNIPRKRMHRLKGYHERSNGNTTIVHKRSYRVGRCFARELPRLRAREAAERLGEEKIERQGAVTYHRGPAGYTADLAIGSGNGCKSDSSARNRSVLFVPSTLRSFRSVPLGSTARCRATRRGIASPAHPGASSSSRNSMYVRFDDVSLASKAPSPCRPGPGKVEELSESRDGSVPSV